MVISLLAGKALKPVKLIFAAAIVQVTGWALKKIYFIILINKENNKKILFTF